MKIVCESCSAKYSIADEKVAGRVFKIRCKKCGSAIVVRGDQVDDAAGGGGAAPAGEEAPTSVVNYGGEAVWHIVIDGEQQGPYAPAQLAEMLSAGTMTWEVFCWREGFDDWKPAQDVEELVQAIMGGAQPAAEPAADPFAASAAPAAVAARDGGRDLFAAQSASPFGGGADEDDGVVASAPAPRVSAEQSLTGARNENSVLFSLSNLQALATGGSGGGGAPASSSSAASPSVSAAVGGGPRAGMAAGEGSGLIDIRALASATSSAGPGSAPKADRVDDLLSIGGAGSAGLGLGSSLGAPVLVPEKKEESNKGMLIGIIAAAAVVVVAIVSVAVIVVVTNDDDDETPVAAAGSLNTGETVNQNTQTGQTGNPGTGTQSPQGEQPPPPQGEQPNAQETGTAQGAEPEGERGNTGGNRPRTGRREPGQGGQQPAQAGGQQQESRPSRDPNPSSERATGGGDIDDLLNDALGSGGGRPQQARPQQARQQPAEESGGGGGGGTGPQTPSRSDVMSALNGVQGAVAACGNGTHGTANVRIVFSGRTGQATNATVGGGNFPPPVMSCIARAARGARVPPFQNATFSVNYPFRL